MKVNIVYLNELVNRLVKIINRTDTNILLLLFIYSNFLSLRINSDEEFYLAVAKQFIDQNWFPSSFSFNQYFGARWLYQVLSGTLLKYFSFEFVAFTGKIFFYGIITYPISKIAKYLSVSNLYLLAALQLFVLIRQSFFAGSHIFPGFVPQLIAHLFILYAIAFYLDRKWILSFAFVAFSMYWHVIVGGWMLITLIISFLYEAVVIRKKVKVIAYTFILVFPYMVFLATNNLVGTPSIIEGINLDWIYVYYRAPNHLGLFKSLSFFYFNHLHGLVWLLMASISTIFLIKLRDEKAQTPVLRLVLITFCINIIFALISIFDKTGILLKFYPFRTQTFGVLLFIVTMTKITADYIRPLPKAVFIKTFIAIYLLLFVGVNLSKNIYVSIWPHNKSYYQFISFINNNSKSTDVFAFDEAAELDDLSFSRKTMRKRLVEFNFVPAGGSLIFEWYIRVIDKEKAFNNLTFISLKDKYDVTHICTNKNLSSTQDLKLIYSNSDYYLYEIDKN